MSFADLLRIKEAKNKIVFKPRQPKEKRKRHQNIVMSAKQAERMKSGRQESKPSDYTVNRDSDAVARQNARWKLEDAQMMRDLMDGAE